MRIVIIEDEELLSEDLKEVITRLNPAYEVVKILPSVKEAIEYFKKPPSIDLIFSDIELGDGQSFDIFKKVTIKTSVVFCTAYSHFAIEAFKANGIDYILKPFDKKSVATAIDKFNNLKSRVLAGKKGYEAFANDKHSGLKNTAIQENDLSQLAQLLTTVTKASQQAILTYQADKIIPIKVKDIQIAFSKDEKNYILYDQNKKAPVNYSLDELEEIFGVNFYRATRQVLINKEIIKEVNQYFARKLLIIPTFDFHEKIIVSKAKATEFLNWLKQ